jgi:hypothetical protein
MGCHYHSTALSLHLHRQVRAVVERAAEATFRTTKLLIGGQVQTGLDLGSIKELLVFAAHHEREPRKIREHGPCPILPVQPQEYLYFWPLMGRCVALDHRHRSAQLLPVRAVARVAEGAEPLVRMHLQDRGAGPDDLSTFAPGIARSTEGAQASLGSGPILCLGQSPLTGGFAGAIDVENEPGVPCRSHNPPNCPSLLSGRESPSSHELRNELESREIVRY